MQVPVVRTRWALPSVHGRVIVSWVLSASSDGRLPLPTVDRCVHVPGRSRLLFPSSDVEQAGRGRDGKELQPLLSFSADAVLGLLARCDYPSKTVDWQLLGAVPKLWLQLPVVNLAKLQRLQILARGRKSFVWAADSPRWTVFCAQSYSPDLLHRLSRIRERPL